MALKTNYKDDAFSGERKYQMRNNSDGTVSFIDVTNYSQQGDVFSAGDINTTNAKVNEIESLVEGMGDRIVETGINDDWEYIKYQSGRITLSRIVGKDGLKMTNSNAGTYYDSANIADRIELTVPVVSKIEKAFGSMVTDRYGHGHSSGIFLYEIKIPDDNKITVCFRAHSSISNGNGYASVELRGRWK